MTPQPEHRTIGDEIVKAADRDIDQLRYIESLYKLAVSLLETVDELRAADRRLESYAERLSDRVDTLSDELDRERTARERLELRLYAHELRDADAPLATVASTDEPELGELVDLHSHRCAERIAEYAPEVEPIPTTDDDPA